MNILDYLNKPMYTDEDPENLFILTVSNSPIVGADIIEVRISETREIVQSINKDIALFAIGRGAWKLVEKAEYQEAWKHIDNMLSEWYNLMENPELLRAHPELSKLAERFDVSILTGMKNILEEILE